MKRTTIQRVAVLSLFGVLAVAPALTKAQEHPEHPAEHPEHSEESADKAPLTIDQLADAITAYVDLDAKAKGGYFLVYDTVAQKPLVLTLDHVHTERLSSLGQGVYFACADFKSTDGKVYDVDVFMQEAEHGLETTEVHVHKVDGEPRYTWKETGGIWSREAIK